MKSYSKLRRRAALGRARDTARRSVRISDRVAAARLTLYAPPAVISPGEAGRETLHLRSDGNPLEDPNDPLSPEGSAQPVFGPPKGAMS